MMLKILKQLEKLDSRTLEENIQLCGQLELAIKNWQFWRRAAWAVHLLLFGAAGSLLMIMTWVETLMETGHGTEIPPILNPVSPRILVESDTPVLYRTYFTLILILLMLSILASIVFAVKYRTAKLPPSTALKLSQDEEQFHDLQASLEQAYSTLSRSGGILQYAACIVFVPAALYLYVTFEMEGPPEENLFYLIGFPLLFFVLLEVVFLISALPMRLLFSTTKEAHLLLGIKSTEIYLYKRTLQKEALKKEEEAKLAAMTPEERRQYEWLKEHEARKREEKKRREEREMEEFLATHRMSCRFYSAGICNYYSTPSYNKLCDCYSNPGRCSAAIVNKGLIYVPK